MLAIATAPNNYCLFLKLLNGSNDCCEHWQTSALLFIVSHDCLQYYLVVSHRPTVARAISLNESRHLGTPKFIISSRGLTSANLEGGTGHHRAPCM
jgi:hypothetical protein